MSLSWFQAAKATNDYREAIRYVGKVFGDPIELDYAFVHGGGSGHPVEASERNPNIDFEQLDLAYSELLDNSEVSHKFTGAVDRLCAALAFSMAIPPPSAPPTVLRKFIVLLEVHGLRFAGFG